MTQNVVTFGEREWGQAVEKGLHDMVMVTLGEPVCHMAESSLGERILAE